MARYFQILLSILWQHFLLQPFPRRKWVSCKHSLSPKGLAQSSLPFFFGHLGIGQKTSPLIKNNKASLLTNNSSRDLYAKEAQNYWASLFHVFFFIDQIAQLFYYRSHYPKELFAMGDQLKLFIFPANIN